MSFDLEELESDIGAFARPAVRGVKIVGGMKVHLLPSRRRILSYWVFDRENWVFRYPSSGHLAGSLNAYGYRRLRVDGIGYAAHRLIWKLEKRRDPTGFIDHINGVRDDNRIENLRDVTPTQNMLNVVRGRFRVEKERRDAVLAAIEKHEREERQVLRDKRERATLARLKAKYEPS